MVSRMENNKSYSSPALVEIALQIERGYSASNNGIEQPDYGGEDNL